MSDPKHTPGPWHIGFDDGSGCGKAGEEGGIWITGHKSYLGLDDFSEDHLVVMGAGDGWDVPQGVQKMEDAHLIAAAPDLLEACQDLMSSGPCDACYEDGCSGWSECGCSCHQREDAARLKARAAIDKALGVQTP